MTSRIDEIGQNGNTGEHYLVEKIAKLIHKDFHVNPRYDWTDFIPVAIEILEAVRDEQD